MAWKDSQFQPGAQANLDQREEDSWLRYNEYISTALTVRLGTYVTMKCQFASLQQPMNQERSGDNIEGLDEMKTTHLPDEKREDKS